MSTATTSMSSGHAATRTPGMAMSAKVVLLGDSAVGKSSIALRFARNEFHDSQETTIGAAFMSRTLIIPSAKDTVISTDGNNNDGRSNDNTSANNSNDTNGGKSEKVEGRSVKFEIWDTAGQERYRSLAPIYYRGAVGALIVYDITNADSLAKAGGWIKELQANGSPSPVIVLVGNKSDLDSERHVPLEVAQAFATAEGVTSVYETSAKDGSNIEQTFIMLGRQLLEQSNGSDASRAGSSTGRAAARRGAHRLINRWSPIGQDDDTGACGDCC